jgi:hypothetical protein
LVNIQLSESPGPPLELALPDSPALPADIPVKGFGPGRDDEATGDDPRSEGFVLAAFGGTNFFPEAFLLAGGGDTDVIEGLACLISKSSTALTIC